MQILTYYGWLHYISKDQYISGDYDYVESIFDDDNAPHHVWVQLFNVLKVDHIEIVQAYSGEYYWTIL